MTWSTLALMAGPFALGLAFGAWLALRRMRQRDAKVRAAIEATTSALIKAHMAAADSPLDHLTPTNPGTYAAVSGMIARERQRQARRDARWN